MLFRSSVAIGLNSDSSSPCSVTGGNTIGICADAVEFNGEDVLDLFSRRRALDSRHAEVEKNAGELQQSHDGLEKQLAAQVALMKEIDAELRGFDALKKEFAALEAELETLALASASL